MTDEESNDLSSSTSLDLPPVPPNTPDNSREIKDLTLLARTNREWKESSLPDKCLGVAIVILTLSGLIYCAIFAPVIIGIAAGIVGVKYGISTLFDKYGKNDEYPIRVLLEKHHLARRLDDPSPERIIEAPRNVGLDGRSHLAGLFRQDKIAPAVVQNKSDAVFDESNQVERDRLIRMAKTSMENLQSNPQTYRTRYNGEVVNIASEIYEFSLNAPVAQSLDLIKRLMSDADQIGRDKVAFGPGSAFKNNFSLLHVFKHDIIDPSNDALITHGYVDVMRSDKFNEMICIKIEYEAFDRIVGVSDANQIANVIATVKKQLRVLRNSEVIDKCEYNIWLSQCLLNIKNRININLVNEVTQMLQGIQDLKEFNDFRHILPSADKQLSALKKLKCIDDNERYEILSELKCLVANVFCENYDRLKKSTPSTSDKSFLDDIKNVLMSQGCEMLVEEQESEERSDVEVGWARDYSKVFGKPSLTFKLSCEIDNFLTSKVI